jgi:hypothetical protein
VDIMATNRADQFTVRGHCCSWECYFCLQLRAFAPQSRRTSVSRRDLAKITTFLDSCKLSLSLYSSEYKKFQDLAPALISKIANLSFFCSHIETLDLESPIV